MRHGYVQSARGTTHYWTNDPRPADTAPCLVFCHGLTADHTLFDMQVAFWEHRCRILTWDWPLHGDSRPYDDFTFDHVAEELRTILTAEQIRSIVLVGQSAGGYIGQAIYQAFPDDVAGFVGIGTTPFGISRYYKSSDLFWIRHFAPIASLFPFWYYRTAAARAVARTEPAQTNMRESLERLGRKGMLMASKAVYDEFLRREEPVDFRCPVLLTHGQHDKTGFVASYNRAWAADRGYSLQLVPDAAHNANYDNHQAFNEMLAAFLAKAGLVE
ncbi:MAG: alpha/beta hydrolase [Myxococcota bacterium]